MRIRVFLTEEEQKLAANLAEKRNRKIRIESETNFLRKNGFDSHYEGMLGEIAVARHYGVGFDSEVFDYRGDSGFDLSIFGYKVDVKTTSYIRDPLMRVKVGDQNEADIYILCAVDSQGGYVDIVGWATKERVFRASKRRLGDKLPMNYILNESDLRSCRPSNQHSG